MIATFLDLFYEQAVNSGLDLMPIIVLIGVFQYVIVRQPVPHLPRVLAGLAYVAVGLALFRVGLDDSLIPIGRDMARQLVQSSFGAGDAGVAAYLPILAFAALIGFTAALIEPTLSAAAGQVEDLSGGALQALVLRLLVACGVAVGLVLGTLRVIDGIPLPYLLAGIVPCLMLLAYTAPRAIVPLALDSGGIATSVVTVPLIAAYGAAIAEALPNEATAADGFGLIVLALLFPAILLLAGAQVQARLAARARRTGGGDAV